MSKEHRFLYGKAACISMGAPLHKTEPQYGHVHEALFVQREDDLQTVKQQVVRSEFGL